MTDIFLKTRHNLNLHYGIDFIRGHQTNFLEFDYNKGSVNIYNKNCLNDKTNHIELSHQMLELIYKRFREIKEEEIHDKVVSNQLRAALADDS